MFFCQIFVVVFFALVKKILFWVEVIETCVSFFNGGLSNSRDSVQSRSAWLAHWEIERRVRPARVPGCRISRKEGMTLAVSAACALPFAFCWRAILHSAICVRTNFVAIGNYKVQKPTLDGPITLSKMLICWWCSAKSSRKSAFDELLQRKQWFVKVYSKFKLFEWILFAGNLNSIWGKF